MAEPGQDEQKRRAAARALAFVKSGMSLGLGTGSTAKLFVELLAARVADGLDVACVPSSEATRAQAQAAGIRLTSLDDISSLDLTIDGADEVDPQFRLIKGGGGALLREKIVAAASGALIVIVDDSKTVERLGRFPLPVEVNAFGLGATRRLVQQACSDLGLDGKIVLRQGKDSDAPFVTDGGHLILDLHLGSIPDPDRLADRLVAIPGVVEHGLFIGYAKAVIVAGVAEVRVIRAAGSLDLEDRETN